MARYLPSSLLRKNLFRGYFNRQLYLRMVRPQITTRNVYHVALIRQRTRPLNRYAKLGFIETIKERHVSSVVLALDIPRILYCLAQGVHFHNSFVQILK